MTAARKFIRTLATAIGGFVSSATNDFVADSDLSLSNVTDNDVSTTKHGFAPKGTGTGTKFLNDQGSYSAPVSSVQKYSSNPIVDLIFGDYVPFAGVDSGNTYGTTGQEENFATTVDRLGGFLYPNVCDFRLTALNGVAVPTTDQTSVGTLYLTPCTDGSSVNNGSAVLPSVRAAKNTSGGIGVATALPAFAEGDLLVLFATVDSNATLAINQGWTIQHHVSNSTASQSIICYKKAGASETAPILSSVGATVVSSCMVSVQNGDYLVEADSLAAHVAPGSTTTTYNSVTSLGPNRLLLAYAGEAGSNISLAPPSGFTDVGFTSTTLSGTACCDVGYATAGVGYGATGAKTGTSASNVGVYSALVAVAGPSVGYITLWDGTRPVLCQSNQVSLSLTATSGKGYDVFAYLDSFGNVALESLVWTSDTVRATGLSFRQGGWYKQTDLTRRWVGSFYANGTNLTEDSVANGYVYSAHNRVPRMQEAAFPLNTTWTYTLNSVRAANALTTAGVYSFNVLCADPRANDMVHVSHSVMGGNGTAGDSGAVGIGIDSTTVDSSQASWCCPSAVAASQSPMAARYDGFPGFGRHNFQALEIAAAAGTFTWNKSNTGAGTNTNNSGMTAWMER